MPCLSTTVTGCGLFFMSATWQDILGHSKATMPLSQRVKAFCAAVDELHWCHKDDCAVEAAIGEAVKLAVEYNLALKTNLPNRKNMPVAGFILAKATACKHYIGNKEKEVEAAKLLEAAMT